MIIPTNHDIAAALRKLQPSERQHLDDTVDLLHDRLWLQRRKHAKIERESLVIVLAKIGAVLEQTSGLIGGAE